MLNPLTNLTILPRALGVWALGQMGYVFKGAQTTLAIDLCLSDHVRQVAGDFWVRAYPPPIEPQALTGIDILCLSHDHLDHLDPDTVVPLAQANPTLRFVVNGWCAEKLRQLGIAESRLIVGELGKRLDLAGVSITPTLSAHYDTERHPEKGYRWWGFLLEFSHGVTVYHAGDTLIYPDYVAHLRALPPADLAFLPVNGRDTLRETAENIFGNLHPQEAAYLAQTLGWQTVIVGHNDLFPNNAIPYAHIAEAFAPLMPTTRMHTLSAGELYYYVKAERP